MKKRIVIFDIEGTTWEDALQTGWGGPNQHPEIVQIGATKVDERFNAIGRFEVLIRPTINPVVSRFFTELTGITQQRIDAAGVSFTEGYSNFLSFCIEAYVACNGWDREVILENLVLYGLVHTLPLVDSVNIRPWIAREGIPPQHQTSGKLATYVGVSNQIERGIHDGLYDSESIRLALQTLLNRGHDIRPFIEEESSRQRECVRFRQLIASRHPQQS
jgi:inhibitor of KinA sporulation pathway (predicted exonuclease)